MNKYFCENCGSKIETDTELKLCPICECEKTLIIIKEIRRKENTTNECSHDFDLTREREHHDPFFGPSYYNIFYVKCCKKCGLIEKSFIGTQNI